MPRCKIGACILDSDLSCLASVCQRMVDSGADYLHLDVMDGHFVPNITFGHPVVKSLRTNLPQTMFDVHMMVQNPEQWIEDMADAGVNHYTFHIEAADDIGRCIRKIREAGMQVGVGLNPDTAVDTVVPYVDQVDTVLILTVEPGFAGQTFMEEMVPKIQYLRQRYPRLDIEVNGGVTPTTIQACAEAGANMIASGYIAKSDSPREAINILRQAVEEAAQKSQLES